MFLTLGVLEMAKLATCQSDDLIEYCDSAYTCV